MLSGAMLKSAITAKYADAPPCPTEENSNAAKNISGMIKILRLRKSKLTEFRLA